MNNRPTRPTSRVYAAVAAVVVVFVLARIVFTRPVVELDGCCDCPTWSARKTLPQCRTVGEMTFEERNVEQLIKDWDKIRLNELWNVQGLAPDQVEGGMRDFQAALIIRKLDSERSAGRNFRHICETGFFRGGSSLLWLMLFPEAKVHSFDLRANPEAVKWLKYRFGDRFTITLGDSVETVPNFAAKNPAWCDLVFVDGWHEQDVPYKDILHFRKASHKRTLLVADDTFDIVNIEADAPEKSKRENDCSKSWKRALDDEIIKPLMGRERMCQVAGVSGPWPIGHCWADYNFV